MPKKINERVFDLRDWQIEACRACVEVINNGGHDFLCEATPGAGKTKFALRMAYHFIKNGLCDRIVIVTYSENLKRQWAAEAAAFAGLDVDPDFKNDMGIEASDYHGISVTYALLGQDKNNIHQQNSFKFRTLAIFDEVHHAGESLTWGDAIKNAFGEAVFRLAISGTAFRSDDCKIPFISYENGISKADYVYSYERAIKENVCRPVYFSAFEGKMKWSVETQTFEHTFKDSLTPDQVSKRLRTALDANGNWVKDLLRAANEKLSEIRHSHPDAGGLITCCDQKHAKGIAKVLQELTGEKPPIVISDEGKGSEQIEAFKSGHERWIVSVKMVSEGVDIPRLRVAAYLTNVKAELFFRQFTGRVVRVLKGLQYQDAFVFIPQDREIVKLAESIQEEREHALDDSKAGGGSAASLDLFSDYQPALKGKFEILGSTATSHKEICVNVNISGGVKHSIDTRKAPSNADPVYLKKAHLRERLNALAKRIALNHNYDFKFAHSRWIEQGGKSMELETVAELENREKFYNQLLKG